MKHLSATFIASAFMLLTFSAIAQDSQFSSIGIGVAPINPSVPSDGTTLNLKTGWGDYIQFRKTQDNGRWAIHNPQNGNRLEFLYKSASGSYQFNVLNLDVNGKVYIGGITSLPGNYKLYVENGILTERVKVALKTTSEWSDYVFNPQYKLMSLSELKTYIQKNQHLPAIPSAQEMVAEGNDLAVTDARLLAKIEELTLYILQLNEKIEAQDKEIQKLKKNNYNK